MLNTVLNKKKMSDSDLYVRDFSYRSVRHVLYLKRCPLNFIHDFRLGQIYMYVNIFSFIAFGSRTILCNDLFNFLVFFLNLIQNFTKIHANL